MIFPAIVFCLASLLTLVIRRTVLALSLSAQWMALASALLWAGLGSASGNREAAWQMGLVFFLSLTSIAALGMALTSRLLYLKKKTALQETRTIKH